MRHLVTGGLGFIGSHLTDTLLAAGHDVLVLDDNRAGNLVRDDCEVVQDRIGDWWSDEQFAAVYKKRKQHFFPSVRVKRSV